MASRPLKLLGGRAVLTGPERLHADPSLQGGRQGAVGTRCTGRISGVHWLIGSPGMGKGTESQTLRCRRVNPGPNLQLSPAPCLFWGISGFLVPSESFPPGLVLTRASSVHQPYQPGTRTSLSVQTSLGGRLASSPRDTFLSVGEERPAWRLCWVSQVYTAPSYSFQKRLKTLTDSLTP